MARSKKVETNTASIVDEKNTTVEVEKSDVGNTSKEIEEVDAKPAVDELEEDQKKPIDEEPTDKTDKKSFKDNDEVVLKCVKYANMSIILPTRTVELDEKGTFKATGIEANRLLTIPGYELAK